MKNRTENTASLVLHTTRFYTRYNVIIILD